MLASFLKIMFSNALLFSIILIFIQLIGIKNKSKLIEEKVTWIGYYFISMILFLTISSLILILCFCIYIAKYNNNNILYSSGLMFIIFNALSSYIIEGLYWLVIKIHIHFNKEMYKLNNNEKIWSLLFILLVYAISFFVSQKYYYSILYFEVILGYLFWLHPTLSDLRQKKKELLSLSRLFWIGLFFVLLCYLTVKKYEKEPIKIVASIIGIIIGFIIGIFFMEYIAKKMDSNSINKKAK